MSSEEGPKSTTVDFKCEISRNTQSKAFQELNELRKKNTLCDVKIVVQETVFPCHRNVLTAASNYFRIMFTNNFEEQKNEDVKLNDVEADIFEQILNFMYTGEIRINNENVTSLLVTCEYLGLQYIEDLCLAYIKNHVPLNNIAGLFSFASRTKKVDLIHTLFELIRMNFISLSKSNELLELPANDLGKILNYMGPKMNTDAAIVLLSKWMEVHQDKTSLVKLLQRVNINNISVCCLSEVLANSAKEISEFRSDEVEMNMQSNEDDDIEPRQSLQFLYCCETITSEGTTTYDLVLHSVRPTNLNFRKLSKTFSQNPNIYVKTIVPNEETIYGFHRYSDSQNITSYVWIIDPSLTTPRMKTLKCYYGSAMRGSSSSPLIIAAIRPRIYFYYYTAGTQQNAGQALTSYNCERDEWIKHTGVVENLVPVCAPSMVSLNDNLYVIGGTMASNDVYVHSRDGGFAQFIDPRTSRWNRLPNSLFEHINAAACTHDGKIYVTGGKYLSYFDKVAEVFDPVAGKWSALPPMPICKMNHSMVSFEHCLYAVGGLVDGDTLEHDFESCVYDIKNDKWINTSIINDVSETNKDTQYVKILDALVI